MLFGDIGVLGGFSKEKVKYIICLAMMDSNFNDCRHEHVASFATSCS